MGVLKDRLILEVWVHLKGQPGCRTLLTALNSPINGPSGIRKAWSDLQVHGKTEGLKKKTGLQAVLQERSDVFLFKHSDRGHLLIELTPGGQATDEEALSNSLVEHNVAAEQATQTGGVEPTPMMQAIAQAKATGALNEIGVASSSSSDQTGLAETPPVGESSASVALGVVEPPAKRACTDKHPRHIVDFMHPVRNHHGLFMDIVWTPEIAKANKEKLDKKHEMARAVYSAIESFGSKIVTLSQIGADFKVSQLKKDPFHKNVKLVDFLREYPDVFEMVPDVSGPGCVVRLQPGAQAALPGAEVLLEQQLQEESQLSLPERIEDPKTAKEKMQALRIELVHALARRRTATGVQEIGQEPKVQLRKQGLAQAKRLIDFLRLFPSNFKVGEGAMHQMVELISTDVKDQTMIDQSIVKTQQAYSSFMSSKGRGRGAGHSMGGRDFRDSASRHTPPPPGSFYGYHTDPHNAGLGAWMHGHSLAAPPGFAPQPPMTGFGRAI